MVLFSVVAMIAPANSHAAEPTVIQIGSTVKVKNCNRLGAGALTGIGNAAKLPLEQYKFECKDLPPGTKGKVALLLRPGKGKRPAGITFSRDMHSTQFTDCNRVYQLSFWGKAAEKNAKITVSFPYVKVAPKPAATALTPQWKHYKLKFDFTGRFPASGRGATMRLALNATDGAILLDDIEFEGLGYKNPTPWVDEPIETLRFANLGILRRLPTRMGCRCGLPSHRRRALRIRNTTHTKGNA